VFIKKFYPCIFLIFIVCCLFHGQRGVIYAEEFSELDAYLRKSTKWNCTTLEKEIPLNIYFKEQNTGSEDAPVIVYVKNHGGERIGLESDLSILSDYIEQRYIIITADFANDPRAISPRFDKDLHQIFQAIYGYETTSLLEDIGLKPRQYRCFFLPAGYRLAADLVYWEIDKHAVYGSLKYIMYTYNNTIVGKMPGKKRVSSPEELTDREGKPFDYKICMDIIYPSKAKKKIPLVYYLATQTTRNPNGSPEGYRPHMAGFTMRGYAYALIGHCYNTVIPHYWHFERFTLDHWNGLACYTAAIRFIRAHADEYNINADYIGGVGHSKGQYSVTRLSDPHHADTKEDLKFEGEPEGTPEPQPYPGYSSRISVGYQSMGMGLFRPQYITSDYVPTILACGEFDRAAIVYDGHANFLKYLKKLDVNHIELFMKGLGHEIPYGYDEEKGFDRYQLMHDFFDRYLRVEEKLPPVVLVLTPRDQKENVSPSDNISIHFAPVMDEKSVTDGSGVKIIRLKDNTQVKGKWEVLYKKTKFIFTPGQKFIENERYKVIVTTNVKNENGTHLDKERIAEFKVEK